MMVKHFAAVFIAASALLAVGSDGAFARSSARHIEHLPRSAVHTWAGETGKASYYGPAFNGHRAADGGRFNQMALTAAHPWLPFGTRVRVMLADCSRSVVVTITDRIYSRRRVVDLSVAAARALGMIRRGVAQVSLVPV